MELKGGRGFLLLCCAILVTSLEIKSDQKIKECARQLMKQCKQNGLGVPDIDTLATVLGSDVRAEEKKSPTTLLSMVESVMESVSSGYKPSKDIWGKTGSKLSDISLPRMIQKMMNISESSACFVNAVAAPMAWDAVANTENKDTDLTEYETLLSAAKTALIENCFTGDLNLPKTINEQHMKSLMNMLSDVYSQTSEQQRKDVMTWYKETIKEIIFKCTSRAVNCKSLNWLTPPVLGMLGPYLSEISEKDIDFTLQQEMCDFFKSTNFKPIMEKINKMKPSLARQLLSKFKLCFDTTTEKQLLDSLNRLGPLSCYLEPSSLPPSTDSLKLLSALSNCDNPNLAKMKKKLMDTATQNINKENAYETLRQMGSAAKFLKKKINSVVTLMNKDDLKKLMNDSSIDLTKKQKRVILDKILEDKKCGKLSQNDLEALVGVADELQDCYYKNMNFTVLDNSDLLKKMSKKLKKSQGLAILKGLGKMTPTQMMDSPNLVQILPLRRLNNYNMSWDQFAAITWRPGQAKLLAKNMTEEVSDWYRIAQSILQGVTCKMIEATPDSKVVSMAQSLADSPQWLSKGQTRCIAMKLFTILESNRTDYFKTITGEELSNISSVLLIHLPPEKVKDLPDTVCPVFLNKMQMANLSSLFLNSPSRAALTERALKCLGPDLFNLTTEDMSKLGPLLCEVPPSKLRLLSPEVLRTSLQAMALCNYIPLNHRDDLVDLVNDNFGNPSTWSAATVEELGPLLVLYEDTTYRLSRKVKGMKDTVYYLIQRLQNPPEYLKKALFELIVTDTSMPLVRRRRAPSENSNANIKETTTSASPISTTTAGINLMTQDPTLDLIRDLGLQNVYWTTKQLETINKSLFVETVEILGTVTNYSPQQLTVLISKATEAYGSPGSMNETQVADLGCIAQGSTEEQLRNMAFSLRSLGDLAKCSWNSSQITAVWKGIAKHNSLSAQTLEASDMAALNSFMCGLSSVEIKQLNVIAFMDALPSMDALTCSAEVNQEYKDLVVTAYGNPNTWTAAEVSDLGNLVAGLDATEFSSLDISVFQHITTDCIPLIPPENLAALSLDKITALGPDNAGGVTDIQKAALSFEQLGALAKAIEGAREQNMQNSAPPVVTHGFAAFTKPLLFLLLGLVALL